MTSTFSTINPRTNGRGYKPGMNTLFNLDYGREVPFNNLIKQSRDVWKRNANDTFDGTLDANGYITDGGTALTHNQVVIISSSIANMLPHGTYVLTWAGTGTPSLVKTGTMSVTETSSVSGRKTYSITDWGDGDLLYLRVPVADTDITDVVLCHEDYEGTCGPGEANEFYFEFVNLYKEFTGGIRFMNWLATNQKDGWTDWATRKTENYRTYTHGAFDGGTGRHAEPGVPLEVCIRMQNALQVPAWYCIPHAYTDAAVDSYADMLIANVDRGLKIGVEYSNETWNPGFVQNSYCHTQGLAEQASTGRFDNQNPSYPAWPWSAYRSTQIMRIIEPLFDAAGRGADLTRIHGLQVGSNESANSLDAHVEVNYGVDAYEKPEDYHDSAAITFYWGGHTLKETQWSNNGAADNAGTFEGATKNTINMSKEELYTWWETLCAYESNAATSTSWAWWKADIVDTRGLEMLGYEGQHHIVSSGAVVGVAAAQTIVGYYDEVRFGDLLQTMIQCAVDNGFNTLMHFVAVEHASADGYWGLVPTYSDWPDIETYQRLRAVKHTAGHTNSRGI